jgi:putative transposase
MQLVAGRTGQECNQRKGAFWEDRYHATAVESGDHLARCLVYIDTNMVRAGVVTHPGQWPHCGYHEIQESRKRNVLIDYERLIHLFGIGTYNRLRNRHWQWVNKYLEKTEKIREGEWTRSIAVGGQPFVENVKELLGVRAKGREVIKGTEGYQLREEAARYKALFEVENGDIALENAYPLDINV